MRADRGPARGAPGDALGGRGGEPLGNASADALGAPLDGAVAALRGAPDAAPGALARATAAALAAQVEAVGAEAVGAEAVGAEAVGAEAVGPVRGAPAPAWRVWRHGRARGGARGAWRPAALAAGMAAAVGLGTWALRGGRGADPAPTVAAGAPAPTPAAPASATPDATPAALRALDEAPRLVRFRLRAPGARAVAVVGDFNRWDRAATPLAADAARAGEWTADVPLAPGRHAYAFVVDGRRRVLDPAAPAERDPDFGGAHSVTVVGVAGAP